MRKVTVDDVRGLAARAREDVWEAAGRYARDPKIYLHWTAGRYDQTFADYHINITGDGTIYASTENFADVLNHTWKRNSGSVGIALCCAYGATTNSLGDYPPTPKQIEVMAQVIAAVAGGLWLTIDKRRVMTHGEAANNEDGLHPHPAYAAWNDEEGAGDVRWDLEYLGTEESPVYNPEDEDRRGGAVLRGKANFYDAQAKRKRKK